MGIVGMLALVTTLNAAPYWRGPKVPWTCSGARVNFLARSVLNPKTDPALRLQAMTLLDAAEPGRSCMLDILRALENDPDPAIAQLVKDMLAYYSGT